MSATRLATFVHISDLHFGTLVHDPQTGEWAPDAPVCRFWALFAWFDGLLGHHYRALGPLSQLVKHLRNTEQARLIVTGDLTSYGAEDQFDTADDFILTQLRPPPHSIYQSVGLFEPNWLERAVPGNHDHWPGRVTAIGQPTKALNDYFPALPYVAPPIPLPSGHRLQFAGINTDADVNPFSSTRVFARGRFASQLDPAAALLGPPMDKEVRVLLLHHSRAWPNDCLGMEPASRAALDTFLADQNVRVILTGHIHIPALAVFVPKKGLPPVLEARCGTTTVRDLFPYTWTTLLGKPMQRTLPPNSLLVHRIFEEQGQVWWNSVVHTRTALGFRPLSGPKASKTIAVWP